MSGRGDRGGRAAVRHRFEVEPGDAELRLDQLLARRVPGLSRGSARVLLSLGGVFVDRARVRIASRRLRPGQVVEAWVGGALERATSGARERGAHPVSGSDGSAPGGTTPRAPAIVFHDEHVVVVEKPSGVLSAPTPEGDRGHLADLLVRGPLPGKPLRVVHRLDLETSGLLVLARSDEANRVLSEAFRVHDVEREYLAVVEGVPPADPRTITEPVGGRAARTHVVREAVFGPHAARVRARLETGRTHQVRIHLSGTGHPVLGDRRHGRRTAFDPPRLALHATLLAFAHPVTGERMRFESAWPRDLATWEAALAARADLARS
ncbi:RluA family pseudouridine synthase [bacterium]|nr:RluA family pseudouridine synthase [bacterium]